MILKVGCWSFAFRDIFSILECPISQIYDFWKIEKIDTLSKSPNEEKIRKGSKTDSFEDRMLIFCTWRYFCLSRISMYSDIWFSKTRKKWYLIEKPKLGNYKVRVRKQLLLKLGCWFLHAKILLFWNIRIFIFWRNEKMIHHFRGWIWKKIWNVSKTNNFEGRMLICLHAEIFLPFWNILSLRYLFFWKNKNMMHHWKVQIGKQ